MSDHETEWRLSNIPDGQVSATRQVRDAVVDLDRPASDYLCWPFPELHEMTGPLGAGGDLWMVAAGSGSGKTTFTVSVIEAWRALGKKIYVMPLETRAKRFRTYLACMTCGIKPGEALSGLLRIDPTREHERQHLRETLFEQQRRPYADQVMISEQQAINVEGLQDGFEQAKAFGADIVIVDHIDHVAGGDGSDAVGESKRVCHAALEMVQENDLLAMFTSQLNMEIGRNPDHLAKYQPPRDHHLLIPGVKRHVSSGIIGLYRKVRERGPQESEDDYLKQIAAARKGDISAPDVLDATVMGVNYMKARHVGLEGSRTLLGYDRGRVTSLAERDRYQTEFGGRMRRVS